MPSINETILEKLVSLEQSMSEQIKSMSEQLKSMSEQIKVLSLAAASSGQSSAQKTKAAKAEKLPKAEKAPKEEKEKKEPNAWNKLIADTVAEMKQSGWEGWTDGKGLLWPASRSAMVKDKSGAETEQYVYDGGDNDGKVPTPAIGGMARASYLKQQSDPAARAKAAAWQVKLAEKRSNSSTGSAAAEEPEADAGSSAAPKKGGRPKMTDDQKAAAKLKREAKKVEAPAAPKAEEAEEFEDAEATTPVPAAPVVAPAAPVKKTVALKKKVNLNFRRWKYDGETYYKNDRGDVLTYEHSWMGHFNGTNIDESAPEPEDLCEASIDDE